MKSHKVTEKLSRRPAGLPDCWCWLLMMRCFRHTEQTPRWAAPVGKTKPRWDGSFVILLQQKNHTHTELKRRGDEPQKCQLLYHQQQWNQRAEEWGRSTWECICGGVRVRTFWIYAYARTHQGTSDWGHSVDTGQGWSGQCWVWPGIDFIDKVWSTTSIISFKWSLLMLVASRYLRIRVEKALETLHKHQDLNSDYKAIISFDYEFKGSSHLCKW